MADDSLPGRAARAQLAAVARAYYLQDRSMVQISEEQGISRFRVARLLARAREEGVVRIEVDDAGLPDDALAARLQDALGLRACAVVRSHGDADAVRQQVGAAAAELLQTTLRTGEVLGVAWGRTLTATTSQLEHLPRLTIVQLTGVVSGDLASSPTEVARQAAARSGGDVHPVFAPLVVQDRATAASLRAHPGIAAAVERFGAVTTALLSVGSWDTQDTQLRDVLDLEDLATAITGGCVADIAGILLAEDGSPVDEAFQERCIGITYQQLRAVPRVVAVAAGASKAAAVRAVVRAGLVSELVTDHALAEAVLAGPVVGAPAERGGRGA